MVSYESNASYRILDSLGESTDYEGAPLKDSLFTAIAAVCVTVQRAQPVLAIFERWLDTADISLAWVAASVLSNLVDQTAEVSQSLRLAIQRLSSGDAERQRQAAILIGNVGQRVSDYPELLRVLMNLLNQGDSRREAAVSVLEQHPSLSCSCPDLFNALVDLAISRHPQNYRASQVLLRNFRERLGIDPVLSRVSGRFAELNCSDVSKFTFIAKEFMKAGFRFFARASDGCDLQTMPLEHLARLK
jgi:hypothetical protein